MATVDDVPDNYRMLLNDASPEARTLINSVANRIRNEDQDQNQDRYHFDVLLRGRRESTSSPQTVIYQSSQELLNFYESGVIGWQTGSREFFSNLTDAYFDDRVVLVFNIVGQGRFSELTVDDIRLNEGVLEVNTNQYLTPHFGYDVHNFYFIVSMDRSLYSENIIVNNTKVPMDLPITVTSERISPTLEAIGPAIIRSRSQMNSFYQKYQEWFKQGTTDTGEPIYNDFLLAIDSFPVIVISDRVESTSATVDIGYVRYDGIERDSLELQVRRTVPPTEITEWAHNVFVVDISQSTFSNQPLCQDINNVVVSMISATWSDE